MRIIVAGGRNFADYDLLSSKLDFYLSKTENPIIVCGEAKGADALGKKYALERNIPVLSFPAEWEKYGKSAGFKRNQVMSDNADCLVAFWDGKSLGTKDMIRLMSDRPTRIVRY